MKASFITGYILVYFSADLFSHDFCGFFYFQDYFLGRSVKNITKMNGICVSTCHHQTITECVPNQYTHDNVTAKNGTFLIIAFFCEFHK